MITIINYRMNYSIMLESVNKYWVCFLHCCRLNNVIIFIFFSFHVYPLGLYSPLHIGAHDDLKEMGNQVADKELVGVFLDTVGNIKSYLQI